MIKLLNKKARCRGGNALFVCVFSYAAVCVCVRILGVWEYLSIARKWDVLKQRIDTVMFFSLLVVTQIKVIIYPLSFSAKIIVIVIVGRFITFFLNQVE